MSEQHLDLGGQEKLKNCNPDKQKPTALTPEEQQRLREIYAYLSGNAPGWYEAASDLGSIIRHLDALVVELEQQVCPREHAGLERAMIKMMNHEKPLPDASLGQDVAACAFAYGRLMDERDVLTRALAEADEIIRQFVAAGLALERECKGDVTGEYSSPATLAIAQAVAVARQRQEGKA